MGRSSKLYNSDLAPTPASKKNWGWFEIFNVWANDCLLYTSPSPRDVEESRMPSSA